MVKEDLEKLPKRLVLLKLKQKAKNKKAEDESSAFFNMQN